MPLHASTPGFLPLHPAIDSYFSNLSFSVFTSWFSSFIASMNKAVGRCRQHQDSPVQQYRLLVRRRHHWPLPGEERRLILVQNRLNISISAG